eukprot:UN17249
MLNQNVFHSNENSFWESLYRNKTKHSPLTFGIRSFYIRFLSIFC